MATGASAALPRYSRFSTRRNSAPNTSSIDQPLPAAPYQLSIILAHTNTFAVAHHDWGAECEHLLMKVILFGATGMVGQSVLRQCLLDGDVEAVLSIGRKA